MDSLIHLVQTKEVNSVTPENPGSVSTSKWTHVCFADSVKANGPSSEPRSRSGVERVVARHVCYLAAITASHTEQILEPSFNSYQLWPRSKDSSSPVYSWILYC